MTDGTASDRSETAGDTGAVWLMVGAGVVSAFQVGKATIAMSAVQADLNIDLGIAAWMLSAVALIGAVMGAPIGLLVDRIGAKRMAVSGLAVQALGAALGARMPTIDLLLITRGLEGIGFFAVVVAAPALIGRLSPSNRRTLLISIWATFMPVGLTLSMLASPGLEHFGWRGFWMANAALLGGYAVIVSIRIPAVTAGPENAGSVTEAIGRAFRSPGPWILGGLFLIFAALYFTLFGFLPIFLEARLSVDGGTAGLLAAAAVSASIPGNVAGGALLARNWRPPTLLGIGFGAMALAGSYLFVMPLTMPTVIGAGLVFAFLGAIIPTVIFDAAGRMAPPDGKGGKDIGATLGFAMQGNNIGLIVGPAAAGSVASALGWAYVVLPILVLTALAAILIGVFRCYDVAGP